MKNKRRIPLSLPFVNKKEIKQISKVIKIKILSRGKFVVDFENLIVKLTGKKFAIAVNSGTSGLHMCMKALGITNTDNVITPAYSFIASANCILYENANLKLCDINKDNFLIKEKSIKESIDKNTKAILPVDIFGQSWNLSNNEKFDIPVIVDSCESFGTPIKNNALANVFGFHPNKQITTGEGGAIVTNDKIFANKLRSLRSQGFINSPDYLSKIEIGFNYRLSDINAAIGIAQIKKLPKIIARRKYIAKKYNKALDTIPGITLPTLKMDKDTNLFNYVIILESEKMRTNIANNLKLNNIEYSFSFPPMHHFAYIKKLIKHKKGEFKNTEYISKRILSIPFFTTLSNKQINKVISVIKQAANI